MKKLSPHAAWILAVTAVLFVAAALFRPLLPIDETRYMTVACEMYLNHGWLSPLTMNFEPYHHKPPMLFWLINLFWSVFGPGRWSGLIPVFLASTSVVLLTIAFIRRMMPDGKTDPLKISFLVMGGVPFLAYSTLMMFDLMLTAFILASLLCLLAYARHRKFRYMFLMGLFLGLGVLTKGPVAYLHAIFPMLLAPLWVPDFKKPVAWYGDSFAAIAISVFPVALWLVPVLTQSTGNFAFWLLWEQTAGRVTGNFNDAHIRPFYFYLPLVPLLLAPWIFFPAFWKNLKILKTPSPQTKFLACWVVPVFISFCLISGKQPHYLLPMMPGLVLALYMLVGTVQISTLRNTALALAALVIAGQASASASFFKSYDLRPIARYVQEHQDHPWAFVRNYHGELGFLAGLTKPVTDRQFDEIDGWFSDHPDGYAVIRYKSAAEVAKYEELFSQPYRGKSLGVFRLRKD